jgi:hypothetical protein
VSFVESYGTSHKDHAAKLLADTKFAEFDNLTVKKLGFAMRSTRRSTACSNTSLRRHISYSADAPNHDISLYIDYICKDLESPMCALEFQFDKR